MLLLARSLWIWPLLIGAAHADPLLTQGAQCATRILAEESGSLSLLNAKYSPMVRMDNSNGPRFVIHALPDARKLEDINDLTLLELNLENFSLRNWEQMPERESAELIRRIEAGQATEFVGKSPHHLRSLSDALLRRDPDIMVLEEVGSIEALAVLNTKYLGGAYRPILVPGNGERPQHIGFLIKKDLPFDIDFQSYKNFKWDSGFQKKKKVFNRDMPFLQFRVAGADLSDPPVFAVAGVHQKAQAFDNIYQDFGQTKRGLQSQAAAALLDELEWFYHSGRMPVILAGDFNAPIGQAPELSPLFSASGVKDSLALTGVHPYDRTTHTYFPPAPPRTRVDPQPSQLDSIAVNQTMELNQLVKKARVDAFRDPGGNEIQIPKNFREKGLLPSDHNPTVMKFDFRKMYLLHQAMKAE